ELEMMTRAERLQAYVEATEGRPVKWGVDDCTSWVASWICAELGVDLPRLPFASRDDAHRIIHHFGSLDAIWRDRLKGYANETSMPQLGDVGIVDTSRFGQVGVIFARDGHALWRAAHGTALLTPRPSSLITAWAI
ncbi:MAG: DUF6950 family protein, partial [Phyllobacterium sp.]